MLAIHSLLPSLICLLLFTGPLPGFANHGRRKAGNTPSHRNEAYVVQTRAPDINGPARRQDATTTPSTTTTSTVPLECSGATIQRPAEGETVTNPTPTVTGVLPAACTQEVIVYFDGNPTGYVARTFGIATKTFIATGISLASGVHTVAAQQNNVLGPSRTFNVPSACAQSPSLYFPQSNQPIDGRSPRYQGDSNDVACPSPIIIFVDQTSIGTATFVGGKTFALVGPSLAPGVHTASATQNGNVGPARVFTVSGPAPTANMGGGGRRRKLLCAEGQDQCVSASGAMVCVDSLATNLEQCGSCDGPDCTALPHVDSVTCQDGKCIVESCVDGYSLIGGQCHPPTFVLE